MANLAPPAAVVAPVAPVVRTLHAVEVRVQLRTHENVNPQNVAGDVDAAVNGAEQTARLPGLWHRWIFAGRACLPFLNDEDAQWYTATFDRLMHGCNYPGQCGVADWSGNVCYDDCDQDWCPNFIRDEALHERDPNGDE
jgi:DNA-binding transcriptional LysR family regulator